MARKISDMQRIINFGLDASAESLSSAIEALQVIRSNRFPKQTKTARAKRSDAGKSRPTRTPTSTPPAPDAAALSSSAN